MISKRIQRVAAIGVVCCLILSLVNVVFLASTNSMSGQGHSLRWMRRVRLPSLNNETEMQQRVKSAMQWAWRGYRSKAFGYDFLDVVNKNGSSFSELDLAISLVDSLDTLFLLGFHDEFNEAAAWAESNLAQRFDRPGYVSLFETTIRVLGGLLSAYHLSGREGLLDLADGLGQRLMPGLRSSIFPRCYVSLSDGKTSGQSLLAEFTSIQLEFKYLSVLTDDRDYFDAVEDIMETVRQIVEREYVDGLVPLGVDHDLGRIHRSRIKLGAGGDSYYEYLLKQWLLSGKRETAYRDMYATAISGIMEKMVGRTKKSGLLFLGELEVTGELTPKMDHLVCFIPGMLALGYMNGMPESHLDLAKDLVHTCFEMYNQMPSKLSPEIVAFNTFDNSNDIQVHSGDAFNILRPETVESLMMLYRVTKNETYREWGKVIFEAFEQHCRLPQGGGYSSIGHVNDETPTKFFRQEMDSFFMAETLKYLYMLFSDEHVVPLDKFVLTTEAHPIPIQFEKWISK